MVVENDPRRQGENRKNGSLQLTKGKNRRPAVLPENRQSLCVNIDSREYQCGVPQRENFSTLYLVVIRRPNNVSNSETNNPALDTDYPKPAEIL
jgi:hypothetical protein